MPAFQFSSQHHQMLETEPSKLISIQDSISKITVVQRIKEKPWEFHPLERETSDIILNAIQIVEVKKSNTEIKLVVCSDTMKQNLWIK